LNRDGSTSGVTPEKPAEIWSGGCPAAAGLRWQKKYPKLCAWVEENIEETFTFYRLSLANMPECSKQELKRRTCYSHLPQVRKALCE
jgi:hypothetical protein